MNTIIRKEIPSIGRPLKFRIPLHLFFYSFKILRHRTKMKPEPSCRSFCFEQFFQYFHELKINMRILEREI